VGGWDGLGARGSINIWKPMKTGADNEAASAVGGSGCLLAARITLSHSVSRQFVCIAVALLIAGPFARSLARAPQDLQSPASLAI